MEMKMVKELLLQALEHEKGGVKVYETALKCVQNEDLKEEWEKYLEQTEKHVHEPGPGRTDARPQDHP
jgi:rubrerythrin